MKSWYAIYTRSRHEKDVAVEVEGLGAELFLPLVGREQRWRDRRRTVEFPLFPSYLFLREDFASEESWDRRREVLKIKGVVRILSDDR
ncbi:MAG: hypothetical protein MUC63_07805, partial [Planctomycetes bacterium]|nr:hypothetical protein [Planctomycetota bacterium]